jgi:ferredoxin
MIKVDQTLCVGCGACIDECPSGAISLSNGKALVDPTLCDGCGEGDEAWQSIPPKGDQQSHLHLPPQVQVGHDKPFDGALRSIPPEGRQQSGHDKLCVETCPNGALTWVAEPVPEDATESLSPVVFQPPVVVIPAETRAPLPWHRAVLPAVGGALSWVGREVVPRLAPLALDVLDSALARRPGRSAKGRETKLASTDRGRGRKGRQRRRRKRGQ